MGSMMSMAATSSRCVVSGSSGVAMGMDGGGGLHGLGGSVAATETGL